MVICRLSLRFILSSIVFFLLIVIGIYASNDTNIVPILLLAILIVSSFLILCGINIARHKKGKELKFTRFKFSDRNYYLFMTPLVITIVALHLIAHIVYNEPHILLYFIVFSVMGVIGETLISLYWRIFFRGHLWTYTKDTVFNAFSSWLNLIPWGVGGLMYVYIAKPLDFVLSLGKLAVFWLVFLIAFIVTVFARAVIRYIQNKKVFTSWRGITFIRYGICILPIVTGMIFSAIMLRNSQFIWVPLVLGVTIFIAEYAFGRACQRFLSQKLWTYNYCAYDNGHITPVTILLFALAGIWFVTIYTIITMLIGI